MYVPYQPYPYGPPPQFTPRRDNYRLAAAIICIVLLSLMIGCGLIGTLLLELSAGGAPQSLQSNLSLWTLFPLLTAFALIGGGTGMYFAIRATMGRPSAQLQLPSFLLPLGLTVVIIGVGIAEYTLRDQQGSAVLQSPLLLLSGIMPAVTIFALTSQRLGNPTTWRHAWMSFLNGMFLATIIAVILEIIGDVFVSAYLKSGGIDLQQFDTGNTSQLIALFISVAVVAPLAEEGFKPLGALVIIGRLAGPAEAFLVGMAGGIGFDIFETTGYISSGSADWITVAVIRLGAGLLHGVGAGMATLGYYYLFRGKGVQHRFLKGFGALIYAFVQHGFFNGSTFLILLPGPFGDFLRAPAWMFGLPATGGSYFFIGLDSLILVVLLIVTRSLRPHPPSEVSLMPSLPALGKKTAPQNTVPTYPVQGEY